MAAVNTARFASSLATHSGANRAYSTSTGQGVIVRPPMACAGSAPAEPTKTGAAGPCGDDKEGGGEHREPRHRPPEPARQQAVREDQQREREEQRDRPRPG